MSADGSVILSLVNDGDDPEIYKIVNGSLAGTITPAGRGSIYNMYVSSDCKGIIYRGDDNNLYYSTDQGMFWNTIPERMAIWPDLYITENMKEVYFHYSYYSFNGKVAIYRWKRY